MNTEIICSLIAAGGTLISAAIAWMVSRSTTKREIKKMQISWEREDTLSAEDEFAHMVGLVSKYIASKRYKDRTVALESIGIIRAKGPASLTYELDDLYNAVQMDASSQARESLTKVLEKKRETQRSR